MIDIDNLYNEEILEYDENFSGLNTPKDLISTEEDVREDAKDFFENLIVPIEIEKNDFNFNEVYNKIQSSNLKFGEGNSNFFNEILGKNFQNNTTRKIKEITITAPKLKKDKKEEILFDFSIESLLNKKDVFLDHKLVKLKKKTTKKNFRKTYIMKTPQYYNFQQE